MSQDYELAHIWANRAVGHAPRDSREAAIKLRDQAEAHFSPSEILALQKRAREWTQGSATASVSQEVGEPPPPAYTIGRKLARAVSSKRKKAAIPVDPDKGDKVKIAIILGAVIIIVTAMVIYFGPFQSCLRQLGNAAQCIAAGR